jgi:hypothetical protein
MDSAARVARRFALAYVRRAKYAPEFLRAVEPRKFRNPDTGNEVEFTSLPAPEQAKIYQQWAASIQREPTQSRPSEKREEPEQRKKPKEPSEKPKSDRMMDVARDGRVSSTRTLSPGGRDAQGGVNQSEIVELELDGEKGTFVRKPAEGETGHLRIGIPAGSYHSREAAAYGIDNLLGGRPLVPLTVSRGDHDGSYQQFAEGSRPMHGNDLNELASRITPEDLHRSPDFHRLNLLDLVLGHEDRHRGNLMFSFDGEDETPESLRLTAIDNGLSLASPSTQADHRVYVNPFTGLYVDKPDAPREEQDRIADDARRRGNQAVSDSLSRVDPKLHEQLSKVDLKAAAKALTDSGLREEGAVRAALVRIAALQEDPEVFGTILERNDGDLDAAWREFQHLSGSGDLLGHAGASARSSEIDAAVRDATPGRGWTQPEELTNLFKEMEAEQDAFGDWEDDWSDLDEDAPKRDQAKTPRDQAKTPKEASTVARLWLLAKLTNVRPKRMSSPRTPSRAPP